MAEGIDNPMALWIELRLKFDDAIAQDDAGFVKRVLDYAAWCSSEQSGALPNDTSTAAICAFYEHLPARRESWPMFRRWFTRDQF